jgi:hypothetical protein
MRISIRNIVTFVTVISSNAVVRVRVRVKD